MATAREVWEFQGKGLRGIIKNLRQSENSLERNRRAAGRFRNTLNTIGAVASVGAAIRIGQKAVQNYMQQEQALQQVQAGLISTGNVAGKTFDGLVKQAENLQKSSIFGDEDILQNVTAQLLTFANITGENFDRTQVAALDLAQRLGGDLKGASIQLGKALNDPVANLSALSRSGIQFSAQQKAVIKNLVETNQLGKAQAIILDELSNQYGGSALAATKGFAGQYKQLQNSFNDSLETLGAGLMPFLLQLATYINTYVVPALVQFGTWLQQNSQAVITVIGVIGAAIAIFKTLQVIMSVVTAAQWLLNIALMANPIGLVIIAIAALVAGLGYLYQRSETVRKVVNTLFQAWWKFYSTLYGTIWKGLRQFAEWIQKKFTPIFDWLGKTIGRIAKALGMTVDEANRLDGTNYVAEGVNKVKGLFNTAQVPGGGGFSPLVNQNTGAGAGLLGGGGAGGAGGSSNIRKGISEIKAAAPKVFNINIDALVKDLNVNTTNLKAGAGEIRDQITQLLLAAINDSQTAIE